MMAGKRMSSSSSKKVLPSYPGRFKFANRVCDEWNGMDDLIWLGLGYVRGSLKKNKRNVRGIYFKHLLKKT